MLTCSVSATLNCVRKAGTMKIADIKPTDVLVDTDQRGTGYYRVVKVNRVTITVETEQRRIIKAYPHVFDRKAHFDASEIWK